jgi:uncharacterized protein (TIGR03000 family)
MKYYLTVVALVLAGLFGVVQESSAQIGFWYGQGGRGGSNWGITLGQPYGYGYGGGYGNFYRPWGGGYGYNYPFYGRYNYPYGYGYNYGNYYVPNTYYYTQPYTYTSPATAYYPAQTTVAAPANTATINVTVPENAEVWVDGLRTTQTGSNRVFQTPPLTPGVQYSYELRATWMANGSPVTQTRNVSVQANQSTAVNMMTEPIKDR